MARMNPTESFILKILFVMSIVIWLSILLDDLIPERNDSLTPQELGQVLKW